MSRGIELSLYGAVAILFFGIGSTSCFRSLDRQVAGYSGKEVGEMVEVVRDTETNRVILKVNKRMKWRVYVGPTVDGINFDKHLAEGSGSGAVELDVDRGERCYYQLTTSKGDAIIAERLLPLEGGHNFRDLGGFSGADGKHVKWGVIFRADDLSGLTPDDLRYLESIPLRSIVDFRSKQEIVKRPSRLPQSVEELFAYSIEPGNMDDVPPIEQMTPEMTHKFMIRMNESFVSVPEIVAQYRRFFEVLMQEQSIPTLFHCAAGKDRTGMAAALILSALGVEREAIMRDYMLSNRYLEDKYRVLIASKPAMKGMLTVEREYIEAGFRKMEELYGSVDNYLRNTLNVDIEQFEERFLE